MAHGRAGALRARSLTQGKNAGSAKHAAYLQAVLLTGARPGEVLAMQWQDINTKWKGLTIRDKVEGERVIPLTPYVEQLLTGLPRLNQWVFASPSRAPELAGKSMSNPHKQHDRACEVAGIEGLTLHGLRRSFKSLTEWLEIVASGNAPGASASSRPGMHRACSSGPTRGRGEHPTSASSSISILLARGSYGE